VKKIIVFCLSLVLAIGIMPGGIAFAHDDGIVPEKDCMFIAAGKDATADGSVLMAYNNDFSGNNALHLESVSRIKHKPGETFTLIAGQKIPQPRETYAYKRFKNFWEPAKAKNTFCEGGINEFQVGVLFGTWARSYNTGIAEADPTIANGFGDELWYLILERCKTAKEGVELFKWLVDNYGVGDWAIGSLAIADTNEVWVIEMSGGKHWAAQRVPDDSYIVVANALQLREIDLQDQNNFRGPDDLISFAEQVGVYDPETDGTFDFAKAYGGMEVMDPINRYRIWRAQSLLTPSANIQVDAPYEQCQVFLQPDEKIKPQDLMTIMRSHYEGTPQDKSDGYTLGNPHLLGGGGTLCVGTCNYSAIWQLRGNMPNDIGGVLWTAMASPCSSVYVPFYLGNKDTPEVYKIGNGLYDDKSAFWVYRGISNLISGYYGKYIGDVQSTWSKIEAQEFASQPNIEKKAMELYKKNPAQARAYLTKYSEQQAMDAYKAGIQLQKDLQLKITKLPLQYSSW